MKNAFKTLTVIAVLLTLAFSFAACNDVKEIDEYYQKMKEANSGTVTVVVDVNSQGLSMSTAIQVKAEGNKTYTGEFFGMPATYAEVSGDKVYTYQKDENDKWVKDEGTPYNKDELENAFAGEYEEVFKSENYEYDKKEKGFVAKDVTGINFFEMSATKIVIRFKKKNCVITADVNLEGVPATMTLTFSDIGKTTVTLPTVG